METSSSEKLLYLKLLEEWDQCQVSSMKLPSSTKSMVSPTEERIFMKSETTHQEQRMALNHSLKVFCGCCWLENSQANQSLKPSKLSSSKEVKSQLMLRLWSRASLRICTQWLNYQWELWLANLTASLLKLIMKESIKANIGILLMKMPLMSAQEYQELLLLSSTTHMEM